MMNIADGVCEHKAIGSPHIESSTSNENRLRRFWNYSVLEKFEFLAGSYWALKTRFYYSRFFGRIGRRSKLSKPLRLKNVQNIFIGNNVTIHKYAFLLTLRLAGSPPPRLVINDGCTIGHFSHITCVNELAIGRNVLIADRVHISDNSHVFADPNVPIIRQGVTTKGKVNIGEGTWIGEGVSVLSCNIGKNCVIGSNAVVVNDVPDYCVAVGVPARVISRFNPESGRWEKTA